jgi:hypothetical protein
MKFEWAVGMLVVAVILTVLYHCTGCLPGAVADNVENAAAVAQYKALLIDCREQGKAAKSYAVYERCADEVDRMLCRQSSVRCADGGR